MIIKKANRKLPALAPATLNLFPFDAKFNYCSLIWILHSRHNNKKIKHFQERLKMSPSYSK